MKSLGPYFISYARFGISPQDIHAANYWETVPVYSGLFRPLSLRPELCQMIPSSVKPATLSKFVKKEGKVLKAVIFEWARYYPNQIQDFLQRMKDDLPFRGYMMGLYRGLRVIYRRIHCQDAIVIKELELQFDQNLELQLREEKVRMEKSWELFQARECTWPKLPLPRGFASCIWYRSLKISPLLRKKGPRQSQGEESACMHRHVTL